MLFSRVLSRMSMRVSLNHSRQLISSGHQLPQLQSNNFHSLRSSIQSTGERVTTQVTVGSRFHESTLNSTTSRQFWYSSSASPERTEKQTNQSGDGHQTMTENKDDSVKAENGDDKVTKQTEETGSASEQKQSTSESIKKRRKSIKRTAFSDSDTEDDDLSAEDLVKLVAEKEELLTVKQKEFEKMQDKFLRSYAEIENVMERTKREAENSKKFAIQSFAKSLLDVADNMGRASSVVKTSFSKIDTSGDTAGAVPLLKTLLEGIEMTEKQLAEVFKKFGVEKFDPLNEQFDPNRHHALFQIPDNSKPSGTVAAVLKPGYTLHDRIIRPAEVGVTESVNGETENPQA